METRIEAQTIPLEEALGRDIKRFDAHQIIQHAALMVSFTLLVVTGLPLKFSTWAISQWWAGLWGGIEVTRSVHHFAAFMMVGTCVYHAIYLLYRLVILKQPFPILMVPSRQDMVNLLDEIMYYVGIKKEKPQFDRFNWREKFDYWAIFWGMPVMGLSGFVLMYPVFVSNILPGWIVPAALVAHSDEAMLALAWIAMVHIFFNHFSPATFPMNKSIFTGKLSRRLYKSEHPLEYERMTEVNRKETGEEAN